MEKWKGRGGHTFAQSTHHVPSVQILSITLKNDAAKVENLIKGLNYNCVLSLLADERYVLRISMSRPLTNLLTINFKRK